MWDFLVHCCPAELGSFQLYDIVHAIKNLGLYKEERQIQRGSLGFRFLLPKRRLSSRPSPWALQVATAVPAVPNAAILPLTFLLCTFPVQQKPLRIRLHFALAGRRIWGDHQRWCKALTKNIVLIFAEPGCKCTWRRQSLCRGPRTVPALGNDGLQPPEPRWAVLRLMHGALKSYCLRSKRQRYGRMLL